MFYLFIAAVVANVFVLALCPALGITVWLPIASGALCGLGAYLNRGTKNEHGKP